MTETRQAIVGRVAALSPALGGRVAATLIELESLCEGRTSNLDAKITQGETDNGPMVDDKDRVVRDKTAFEFVVGRLSKWCDDSEAAMAERAERLEALVGDAEDRALKERKQERGEITPLEEGYWFIEEWEGVEYRRVAEKTKWTPDQVRQKRERAGREGKYGRVPVLKAA